MPLDVQGIQIDPLPAHPYEATFELDDAAPRINMVPNWLGPPHHLPEVKAHKHETVFYGTVL